VERLYGTLTGGNWFANQFEALANGDDAGALNLYNLLNEDRWGNLPAGEPADRETARDAVLEQLLNDPDLDTWDINSPLDGVTQLELLLGNLNAAQRDDVLQDIQAEYNVPAVDLTSPDFPAPLSLDNPQHLLY